MEFSGFLRRLVLQFFYIVAGTFMATAVFCAILNPAGAVTVRQLWQLLLFCLLADLPGLVFYTKTELSPRQRLLREGLHTALLLAVLMGAGWALGLYRGAPAAALFALAILFVDLFVHAMTFAGDWHMAQGINRSLRARRKG